MIEPPPVEMVEGAEMAVRMVRPVPVSWKVMALPEDWVLVIPPLLDM